MTELERMYEITEKVDKMLEENHIFASVYPGCYPDVFEVEITWGDWKHEHLRAKWLIKEMGYEHLWTQETEENGTDCYSAIHVFQVK